MEKTSALKLYNSLTKREEELKTIEPGKVRMYTCGPTVYGRPHIGNYSSFLMADLLRRWLEVSGYEVKHVKNITDVGHLLHDADRGDDKVEKQAREEKGTKGTKGTEGTEVTVADVMRIVEKYTNQYLEDERALNLLDPYARPRATETIPEMIAIIEVLMKRGVAYETSDGVYFNVEKFPAYGELSGNKLKNLTAGARVEVKEEKKHPADFALWKKTIGENAHHILRWPSPWGEGFPGWHIECSAMAKKFLGDQLDIHTGGEDNIFPHHECEIAQSESAMSPTPDPSPGGGGGHFVGFWLHKRRIDMGAEKMSKSLGNILLLPDVINAGFSPLDLRYYFLSVHYRTQLKFSWKGLEDAKKARRKIVEWMEEMTEVAGFKLHVTGFDPATCNLQLETTSEAKKFITRFIEAFNSDLNTPAALAAVFDLMAYSRRETLSPSDHEALMSIIPVIRHTFGCFEAEEKQSETDIPADIKMLVDQREVARTKKDFDESDRLRGQIEAKGFTIRDTPIGPVVRQK